MKHTLRVSAMLFACLLVGTSLTAPKKVATKGRGAGIPLGVAKSNLVKAVKAKKDADQEKAFNDIVDAMYEIGRPIGSKAGVFEYENVCIGAINAATSSAKKAGVKADKIEQYEKAAREKCLADSKKAREAKKIPTKKPDGKKPVAKYADQNLVDIINEGLKNVQDLKDSKPTQKEFNDTKDTLESIIMEYGKEHKGKIDQDFAKAAIKKLLDITYTEVVGDGIKPDEVAKEVFGGKDVKSAKADDIKKAIAIDGDFAKRLNAVFAELQDAAGNKGVNINVDPADVDKTKATDDQKKEIKALYDLLTEVKKSGDYNALQAMEKGDFDIKLADITTVYDIIK